MESEQERILRGSKELDEFINRYGLNPKLRQFWKNELRYTWPKGSSSASKDREDEHKG